MSLNHRGNTQPSIDQEEHTHVGSFAGKKVDIIPLVTVYNGTKAVPTGTAEVLATTQKIRSVTMKALSTNTVAVYVGGSGVTTASGFELLAGDSISLDTDDLANVYVISGSAAQVVRYIAL